MTARNGLKDSDYIVMIVVMHGPKRMILVLKLTLGWSYEHFYLSIDHENACFDFHWQYSSEERPM